MADWFIGMQRSWQASKSFRTKRKFRSGKISARRKVLRNCRSKRTTRSRLRENSFQRNRGMQAGQTEEEEVKRQHRMNDEKECGQRTGWMPKAVGGLVNCWRLSVAKCGSTPIGTIRCSSGTFGFRNRIRMMRRREW